MYKCTKHQFIRLLTATLNNSHIGNSKNHKRWCPHHTDWVSVCCWIISRTPIVRGLVETFYLQNGWKRAVPKSSDLQHYLCTCPQLTIIFHKARF